jgi:hypothetical protein
MTALPAGRRMKIAAHVAEASATLSAIRLNTRRDPRTLEYIQRLQTLDDDLLSITARLADMHPKDRDVTEDLREVVNQVQELNRVELASVLGNVKAALSEYIGKD